MNRKQRKRKLKQKKETVKLHRSKVAALYVQQQEEYLKAVIDYARHTGFCMGVSDKANKKPYDDTHYLSDGIPEEDQAYKEGYNEGYNESRFEYWPILILLGLTIILTGLYFL